MNDISKTHDIFGSNVITKNIVCSVLFLIASCLCISQLYRRGWSTCPSGFFLRGLYRSGDNKLYNLEYAKCCKPAYHPYWHGSCYNKDVGVSFDKKGWNLCAANYFMTGFYRSDSQKLYNIEKFKCCKMVSGESIYIYIYIYIFIKLNCN